MNQSSKTVLSAEQKFQRKLIAVKLVMSQGVQNASIRLGVPERTLHSWRSQFEKGGLDGLRERSRAPKTSPHKKDQNGVLEKEILRLAHEEPGLTCMQVLAKLLLVEGGDVVSKSWLGRTRRRLGLTKQRRSKKALHTKRYEIPTPGALQVDSKIVEKAGEPGQKLIQFTAIDECSRVRFLGGSLTKGAFAATRFLQEAIAFYAALGVRVYQVQTDNGTEFTLPGNAMTQASYARGETQEALFTQACQKLQIHHRLIKPRTPEHNGKVERSHRTDEERFYSRFHFDSHLALDHALKHHWMPEYNELRPHSALGGLTPMEFLKKRLKEIEDKNLQQEVQNPELPSAA